MFFFIPRFLQDTMIGEWMILEIEKDRQKQIETGGCIVERVPARILHKKAVSLVFLSQ